MKAKAIIIAGVMSASLANCEPKKDNPISEFPPQPIKTEQIGDSIQNNHVFSILEPEKKELNVCLSLDSDDSFTHKKVLESIENPENVVLEFPLSQLYQKYGNRPHPLAVRGIDKNFESLLGEDRLEDLNDSIPQKLSPRTEKITSNTRYETGDTLRFPLIDPLLQGVFPQNLSQQLKEDGFETFLNPDDSFFTKKFQENQNSENIDKKPDFIYDITVKTLPTGESVLGLYRNGELFMATYVSIGLNSKKTQTGQFEVLWTNPYYFSRKYKSPMSACLYYDEGGRGLHQGRVRSKIQEGKVIRGVPASHGCIRLPGVYALALYSLVKGKKNVDIFISKNLYNIQ